jgi:cbb3-type cytochrome oxidase subunit 3
MRIIRFIINFFQFHRTDWTAVVLCFIVAAIFWVFNTLGKDYAANLTFPLAWNFDARRYAPAGELPQSITLNVTGKGWELLRRQAGLRSSAITLPLERPTEVRKLATASIEPLLASQLANLAINYPVTDTLRLRIEPREKKKIKVSVSARSIAFRGNLGRVSQVVTLPDSVEAEGPASLVRACPDSVLLELPAVRVTENYREQHTLSWPNPLLTLRPAQVTVLFEVAGMQDVMLRVPVLSPLGKRVADSVTCHLWVPDKWREAGSEATRNFFAELPPGRAGATVLPLLRGLPDFVTVIRVDSVKLKTF